MLSRERRDHQPDEALEQEIAERGFSPAFNRLVQFPEDFIGMIAYAIYKKTKKDYASSHSLERNHRDIKNYHKMLLPEQVRMLRSDAESRLDAYVATLLAPVRDQIYLDGVKYGIEKRPSFLRNVAASLAASLLVIFMSLAILVAVWRSDITPIFVQMQYGVVPAEGPTIPAIAPSARP